MKAVLILMIGIVVGATGASAESINLGFFSVSPQGNFLYNSANDNCSSPLAGANCNMSPTFVDLGAYIGDTITVTDVGGLCAFSGPNCTVYAASPSYLGGVFSTSNTLLDASNVNRLPGAVPSGLPNINNDPNLNSWVGQVNTTIPYDFYLPATAVIAAQYLVIGTLDSGFSDNSLGGPGSPGYAGYFGVDLAVNTNPPTPPSPTPEPGTAALLLAGGALLGGVRRQAVKRASKQGSAPSTHGFTRILR
jgi:hypothetical protein